MKHPFCLRQKLSRPDQNFPKSTLLLLAVNISFVLSNDPGKVDSNFFCHAAMVLSPHRNVLIFTQTMHKAT